MLPHTFTQRSRLPFGTFGFLFLFKMDLHKNIVQCPLNPTTPPKKDKRDQISTFCAILEKESVELMEAGSWFMSVHIAAASHITTAKNIHCKNV